MAANFLHNFLSTLVSRALVFLLGLVLARNLGAEVYGEFVLIRSAAQIIETSFGIGLGVVAAKVFLSNPSQLKNFTLCVVIAQLLSIFSFFLYWYYYSSDGRALTFLFIVAVYAFFTSSFHYCVNCLKGIGLFKYVSLSVLSYYIISLLIVLFSTTFWPNLFVVFISFVFSFLVVLVGVFIFFRKSIVLFLKSSGGLFLNVIPFIKKDAVPIFLSSIFSPLFLWLLNIVIASSQDGVSSLAFFNIAYLLYGLMTLVPIVIAEVHFKKLNTLATDYKIQKSFVLSSAKLIMVFSVSNSFLFYFASDFIPKVYGSEYEESVFLFKVFILASLFSSTLPLLGKVFLLNGYAKLNLYSNLMWGVSVICFTKFFELNVNESIHVSASYAFLCSYVLLSTFQWLFYLRGVYENNSPNC